MIEPKLLKIEAVDDYEVCVPEAVTSDIEASVRGNLLRTFFRRLKPTPRNADPLSRGRSYCG